MYEIECNFIGLNYYILSEIYLFVDIRKQLLSQIYEIEKYTHSGDRPGSNTGYRITLTKDLGDN